MVEHPVPVEIDENSSDIELALDISEKPIPATTNGVKFKKKCPEFDSLSTNGENTTNALPNDLNNENRIMETAVEKEESNGVEVGATSCDLVSQSCGKLTSTEELENSADKKTDGCGVENHVFNSSVKVNGFPSKRSSDDDIPRDEFDCKKLSKSHSSLRQLLGNGSLKHMFQSKSEKKEGFTEGLESASEETKKSSTDLPIVSCCDKPTHDSLSECRVNGDSPQSHGDGSVSPTKRKMDPDSGDSDSGSRSCPEKRSKKDDSGNSSSCLMENGYSDNENGINSVASNSFPLKKKTTARKSTGGNAMRMIARLIEAECVEEQFAEVEDLVVPVENGVENSTTDFVDVNAASDERCQFPVNKELQFPGDEGRRLPVDEGCRSPLDVGCRSPLDKERRSPLDEGHRSPLDEGCRSSLDEGRRSPLDEGRRSLLNEGLRSPLDEGLRSPLDEGLRSPLDEELRSPLDEGLRSPLVEGRRSPLDEGRRSPLKEGLRSPLDEGLRSPLVEGRRSPLDEGRRSPLDEGRHSPLNGGRQSPDKGPRPLVNEGPLPSVTDSPSTDEGRLSSTVGERLSPINEVCQSLLDDKKYPIKFTRESMSSERLENFFKKMVKRLSRRQLEELVLQKCCEMISESSEIGELKKTIAEYEQTEIFRKNQVASLERQIYQLRATADIFCTKARLTKENGQIPPPKIIVRSVGLQVESHSSSDPNSPATRASSIEEADLTTSAVISSRISSTDTASSSSCSSPTKSPRPSFSEIVNTGKRQKPSLPTDNNSAAASGKNNSVLPVKSNSSSERPAKVPPAPPTSSDDVIVDLTDLDDNADSPPRPCPPAQRNGLLISRLRTPSELPAPRHPAPLPPMPKGRNIPGAKLPPPKPNLSIQKNNLAIQMTWDLILTADYEPVDKYQIYAYQETAGVPVSVTLWKLVGDVESLDLPMACTLTQFVNGYTYHFAVRAVDKHGRHGPFSCARSIAL